MFDFDYNNIDYKQLKKDLLEKGFKEVQAFLSEKGLLDDNKEAINNLHDEKLGYECCEKLLSTLKYLEQCGLLNQNSLLSCIKITQTKPSKESWEDAEAYDSAIFELVEKLDENKVKINENDFNTLLQLKKLNLDRLDKVITGLSKAELLDSSSFSKALDRVCLKLPTVSESKYLRKSRHNTSSPRSETRLLNDKVSIYSEPGKNIQSTSPRVKNGFSKANDDNPSYILKTISTQFAKKKGGDKREAQREVKYNRLLGRSAFFYSKKHPRLVADFIPGTPVSDYLNNRKLKEVTLDKRLRCIITGLSELNILHSHHRVHGDISSNNFILNLESETLKLIDFDSSHKIDSPKTINFKKTPEFDDPNNPFVNDFNRDIYATGIIITLLFPELYSHTQAQAQERAILKPNLLKNSGLTHGEKAVVQLVDSMLNRNLDKRCTSESALSYCKKVLENMAQLNDDKLENISDSTIHRDKPTVEDVIRRSSNVR